MNIGQLNSVQEIISQVKAVNRAVKIAGTWGSFARLLALHIHEQLKKPILYISPYLDEADNVVDDLIAFGGKNIETLPGWAGEEFVDSTHSASSGQAGSPQVDAADEIRSARARLVLKIAGEKPPAQVRGLNTNHGIISTSIQALMQPVPRPEKLLEKGLFLEVGRPIEM